MWSAVIAADFHLQAKDRHAVERTAQWVAFCSRHTRRVFLLGDVFDFWVSAAMLRMEEFAPLFAALRAARSDGVQIVLLPGNRDFLFDAATGKEIGIEVCAEEQMSVAIADRRVLLTHGDAFLLEDRIYQRFKRVVRSRAVRFLARHAPVSLSQRCARGLRGYSRKAVGQKPRPKLAIVDLAVQRWLGDHDFVFCGHVHRAERRPYRGRGTLFVLPAFEERGEFAVLDSAEPWLQTVDGARSTFPDLGRDQG